MTISFFHATEEPWEWGRDVVRTLQIRHGDTRVASTHFNHDDSIEDSGGDPLFAATAPFSTMPKKIRDYQGTNEGRDLSGYLQHGLFESPGSFWGGTLIGDDSDPLKALSLANKATSNPPDFIPYTQIPVDEKPGRFGDFDMGQGLIPAGALVNKPDEGAVGFRQTKGNQFPYLFFSLGYSAGQALFSPNRMIPSPVMFGSLPSRAGSGEPWRTLLFRPQPAHPGAGSASASIASGASLPPYTTLPDFLILDNFWMPVVEPYAISQPVATSGKINMNYRIAPFDYIERSTAMRAAIRGEFLTAVPAGRISDFKG